MTRNDPTNSQDKWLAAFTDSILNGEVRDLPDDSPNPEMRALASTLLRLKRAFPGQELDSNSVKQMRAQILKRWHEEQLKRPRWLEFFKLSWLTPSQRQQFGMAFAMIVVAGILIVAGPYLFSNIGSLSATAGLEIPGAFVWVVLGALLVFIVWLLRRKP